MTKGLVVTGASGFIGKAVLRALEAEQALRPPDDAPYAGLSRLVLAGRERPPHLPDEARWHALDLAVPGRLELPHGIDTVLHLAGEKRDPARMEAVNHQGALKLAEAAARAGATRFVHLSSVGVYGAPKHSGVVDESSPHTPRNAYERSKDAGERAVRDRCAALGLQCLVLQPSNVIGIVPGRSTPLLGLARTVARGWFRHIGRGDAWVNYVAVDDVAAAILAVLQRAEASGTYIVNTPVPLRELIRWMAEALGRPEPTAHLPRWLGAMAAGVGAVGRSVLGRELPFSPERLLELTNTTRYDAGAIRRTLSFQPPLGIEAAVRAMIRQYRHEGLL